MGQPIPDHIRPLLTAHSDVLGMTAEHILLAAGTVLDPSEFVVQEEPIHVILKLIACPCWFSHRLGTHLIVPGQERLYADGRTSQHYNPPGLCRRGKWLCEEILRPGVRVRNNTRSIEHDGTR